VLRVALPDDMENIGANGICVAKPGSDGSIIANMHDVRVSGFTVRNFPGVGMVFAGGDRIRADHNVAENNTIYGITAFASSHGLFDHNTVTHNTSNGDKCISEVSLLSFDLDGVGVLLAGGRHIVIRDNSVRDNHPTGPIDPKRVGFAGGIVLVSSEQLSPFPGLTGSKPFDNTIADNSLRGNQPFDLAYDKSGSGNRFVSNECRTSMPAGLCDDD